MTHQELFKNIKKKRSFLCVGLDTDVDKLPDGIDRSSKGVFEFNRQIIDATHEFCVAYKVNTAFYESMGSAGWEAMEHTVKYMQVVCPGVFTIADAKRGDIGNTSGMYASAFFEHLNFDSITIAPYMGEDSIAPFLKYTGKWVILLALTSNKGAEDFQLKELARSFKNEKVKLFQEVIRTAQNWGHLENMMFVVGATRPEMLAEVRAIAPDHFLLVPGVGVQGGSLQEVSRYGMNKTCGLLVNISRSILYAGKDSNFAQKAKEEAKKIQEEMEKIIAGSILFHS